MTLLPKYKYQCCFTGRLIGSTDKCKWFRLIVMADDTDDVRAQIAETHESIDNCIITFIHQ